ncbi:2926_t:CDS:10 [Funneliformis geosporum]|uniref:2926_t:CDS:1 n=1 Tax=Funneliformis geosporum TaxID=1117311 RepID=A0A9W4SB01_9GLOM|nr:2926_t:CDS:10 [Funneliformis geosporum]
MEKNTSGLAEYLTNRQIKNLKDYCLGLEVGLGTHGKKNSSGKAMEKAVENLLIKHGIAYQKQVSVNFPVNGKKLFDFQIKLGNKEYYLETSFFNVAGSKVQEVIRSYGGILTKAQKNEINFLWILDGKGLKSCKELLKNTYLENKDFMFSLSAGEIESNLIFYSTFFIDNQEFSKGVVYQFTTPGNFVRDNNHHCRIIQGIDSGGYEFGTFSETIEGEIWELKNNVPSTTLKRKIYEFIQKKILTDFTEIKEFWKSVFTEKKVNNDSRFNLGILNDEEIKGRLVNLSNPLFHDHSKRKDNATEVKYCSDGGVGHAEWLKVLKSKISELIATEIALRPDNSDLTEKEYTDRQKKYQAKVDSIKEVIAQFEITMGEIISNKEFKKEFEELTQKQLNLLERGATTKQVIIYNRLKDLKLYLSGDEKTLEKFQTNEMNWSSEKISNLYLIWARQWIFKNDVSWVQGKISGEVRVPRIDNTDPYTNAVFKEKVKDLLDSSFAKKNLQDLKDSNLPPKYLLELDPSNDYLKLRRYLSEVYKNIYTTLNCQSIFSQQRYMVFELERIEDKNRDIKEKDSEESYFEEGLYENEQVFISKPACLELLYPDFSEVDETDEEALVKFHADKKKVTDKLKKFKAEKGQKNLSLELERLTDNYLTSFPNQISEEQKQELKKINANSD